MPDIDRGGLSLDQRCWLELDESERPAFYEPIEQHVTTLGYTVYFVGDGDVLAQIATDLGVSIDALADDRDFFG